MGNKETEQAAITHVLALEHRQVAAAQANPERFYLYVVDNLAGLDGAEVGVRVLYGEVLLAMIERSRPQVTHWPTFRAAEHDQAERLR
ncbi:hypothetical protein ACGFY7_44045 [Streptomyces prunicolor]|uniref:hypothetical protein n=1 Tax=Streptomyces prunicolor TaxID=67348 RepID=UPI003720258E